MTITAEASLSINDAAPIAAKGGTRLLFALRELGIMLPTACGGRGLCGLCKVRVKGGGGGPHTPEELKKLKPEELENGYRLACRIILEGTLEIEIDRDKLGANLMTATLADKVPLNYDTTRFTLALPEGEKLKFSPGQYLQIEVPAHEKLNAPAWRAYSLASHPKHGDELNIIVRRVPDGIVSNYLHDLAKIGDAFRISGPHGDFRLRPTETPALMLAGGSGLSPFESMLADAAERGLKKPLTLIFGGVARRDLYHLDLLAEYEKKIPTFRFVPALSNPSGTDGWTGETGLVTEVAKKLFPEMSGMEIYLCGSPGMIGACVECFKKIGANPSKIYFDQFG